MIFGNGQGSYRAPTIREAASLMSFPMDYKFYGESIGLKYRLVGNAVPPKMAYAFAKAIKEKESIALSEKYLPIKHSKNGNLLNLNSRRFSLPKEKPRHAKARFKYHIPYLIRNTFRVELTNYHSNFETEEFQWKAEIHKSQGPRARIYTPAIAKNNFTPLEQKKIDEFIFSLNRSIVDFNQFQDIYCKTSGERKSENLVGPFELLELIRNFLGNLELNNTSPIRVILEKNQNALPRQIAMGFYILDVICEDMRRLSS